MDLVECKHLKWTEDRCVQCGMPGKQIDGEWIDPPGDAFIDPAAWKSELDNYERRLRGCPDLESGNGYKISVKPTSPLPLHLESPKFAGRILHHEPETKPEPSRCKWCDREPNVATYRSGPNTICVACTSYEVALRARVDAGGYDIPEERDAVRRYVDSRRTMKVCAECKRTPVVADPGVAFCTDCVAMFGGVRQCDLKPANSPETPDSWTADSGCNWDYP